MKILDRLRNVLKGRLETTLYNSIINCPKCEEKLKYIGTTDGGYRLHACPKCKRVYCENIRWEKTV